MNDVSDGPDADSVDLVMPVVSPSLFLSDFRVGTVQVLCQGEARLARHNNLLGQIRGALGTHLHAVASEGARRGGPCDFSPPCAYQLMWNSAGDVRPGFPAPHPWAIRADALDQDLVITIRLFGFATDISGEIADALVRALRSGLSLRPGGLDIADRAIVVAEGVEDRLVEHSAELEFETPLLLRNSKDGANVEPSALIRTLLHRADGMARFWHGCRLDIDFPATLAATSEVEGTWVDTDVVRWKRSARQQGKLIGMSGVTGKLALRHVAKFSWLLSLGEVIHCGSRTAWGLGRFKFLRTI